VPGCHSSAAGWQGQGGLGLGTVGPWQLVVCPQVCTNGDWENHVYKCSVAIHVEGVSISIRRSGANHKAPVVDSPYPGGLFLMTQTTSP